MPFTFARPFLLVALLGVVMGGYEMILSAGEVEDGTVPTDEHVFLHRHDAELGWLPRESIGFARGRTGFVRVQQNTLGLRDAEPDAARPYRLLVMGGDAVWGKGVEADARFSDLLEAASENWDVVNAGVAGYGTDQSLLLARRLVPELRPTAVLLVFDPATDRSANQVNVTREGHYKPHFVLEDTAIVLRGQPVPKDVSFRSEEIPDAHLARLITDAAVRLLHPSHVGTDPSETLVVRFREEVGRVGASFLVALARPDARLEHALDAAGIPWTLIGAHTEPAFSGRHWTDGGHVLVADRLGDFLPQQLPGWDR